MARIGQEKVLLIGDPQREVHSAVMSALPAVSVTAVADYFEGIAELSAGAYTAVMASAEPVERRPEAAVRTLRELCGQGRLILFGQPSLEGLSLKMLEFGADDYLITPPSPSEIQQIFSSPVLRPAGDAPASEPADGEVRVTEPPTAAEALHGLPLAEVVLEALLQHPADAPGAAVRRLSELVGPTMRLVYQAKGAAGAVAGFGVPGGAGVAGPVGATADGATGFEGSEGISVLSHPIRVGTEESGTLHLLLQEQEDAQSARHFLSQIAGMIGKVTALQERHNRLQKLAITDQLTGVYNRRYFEHFLARIIDKARVLRFPVTLLLFDIDNFKKYNDTYGHGVGDQILRETAAMMKRCSREHDLVARIGGDEFAVVFWEKEGPRLPKDSGKPPAPIKPPQTPQQVFDRFRRLMASQDFPGLGPTGKGVLTISGGLASYPWDGRDVVELIHSADQALVHGAKRGGKDRLFLVGEDGDGRGKDV